MTEFAVFAQELALEAGHIMQSERDNRLQINMKPDRTLVTNIDTAINELVIDAVVRSFPGYSVIGEEASYGCPDAERIVRVDPLDGTGEYVNGSSHEASYGFGIALQVGSEIEEGLFYNPSRSEMYIATQGLGAYLNGERIKVSRETSRRGAPYDYSHWDGAEPDLRLLEETLGAPLGVYSAIYQGCMVASGRSTFSAFPGNTAHNIAPATILVREAEGKVSDLHGRKHNFRAPLKGAVFANVPAHSVAVELIAA